MYLLFVNHNPTFFCDWLTKVSQQMKNFVYPLLSLEQITNTPSKLIDNISYDDEIGLRIYGCELIQKAGILLKLPQSVIARAQILFHRFYMKVSMKEFDVRLCSIVSLFLSTKLEECQRRLTCVLNVFYRIFQRELNTPITPIPILKSQNMRDLVIDGESILLRELGFVLNADYPHKFILIYLNVLEGSKELAQTSWNILNDRYITKTFS